jgi:2'-5' RNA ligase
MPEAGRAQAHETVRVFFALWPDDTVRHGLMQVGLKMHRQLGGKLTREASVHLTLLFLGDIPVERLEALQTLAASVPFEPFILPIEQAVYWHHNRVAWVGPWQTPPALARLVSALEEPAAAQGFRFDRRPFAAHITLLRKAGSGPLDVKIPRIDWQVRDFVLVRSQLDRSGSRYTVIGRWPEVVDTPTRPGRMQTGV